MSEIYLRLTSWWSQEAVQEPLEVKQIIVHILPTISFNTPLEVQAGRKWNFNIGHPPTKHTLGFLIVKWFIKEYTVESKHPHWPFFFLFKVLLEDAWNIYIHILYGSVVPFKMCKRKLSNDVGMLSVFFSLYIFTCSPSFHGATIFTTFFFNGEAAAHHDLFLRVSLSLRALWLLKHSRASLFSCCLTWSYLFTFALKCVGLL